jgi:hypothetical protein
MKKIILSLAVAMSAISTAEAQGLYFGLMPGYGFAAGRSLLRADYYSTFSGTATTTNYKSVSSSLGQGLMIGAYGGYMFSKNVGAELGLSYLMSTPVELSTTHVNAGNTVTTTTEQKLEASTFRLIPALRITTSGESKLQAYMKAGVILGVTTKLMESETSSTINKSTTTKTESTQEYKGPLGLGFHGGVGVMYKISDMIGVFGELGGYLQNWGPTSSALTKYTVDGASELEGMTTSEKETEYLDEFSTTGKQSDSEPQKSTRMYLPFSSVSISIGIHFTLGKSGE